MLMAACLFNGGKEAGAGVYDRSALSPEPIWIYRYSYKTEKGYLMLPPSKKFDRYPVTVLL